MRTTPRAEDEVNTWEPAAHISEIMGPEVCGPEEGILPPEVSVEESLESTPSDTTSFGEDGTETSKKSKILGRIKDTLATTAMVKGVEHDKATGSDVGVDDHAIKLPGTTESALRTCVASRWILKKEEDDIHASGETCTDCKKYEAMAVGELAVPIPKEHESPRKSTEN